MGASVILHCDRAEGRTQARQNHANISHNIAYTNYNHAQRKTGDRANPVFDSPSPSLNVAP